MKNLLTIFAVVLLVFGCKKETPQPSGPGPTPQPTMPGANWLCIGSDTIPITSIFGYYDGPQGATLIGGSDSAGAGGGHVLILPITAPDSINVQGGGSNFELSSAGTEYCNQYITVVVTRYDAVGGLIEGRYEGVAFECLNNNVQVNVKGVFSVPRYPDH